MVLRGAAGHRHVLARIRVGVRRDGDRRVVAGAFWAGYILTTEGTGRRFSGQTGLALALTVGGIGLAPIGLFTAPAAFIDPPVLALGVVVAGLALRESAVAS